MFAVITARGCSSHPACLLYLALWWECSSERERERERTRERERESTRRGGGRERGSRGGGESESTRRAEVCVAFLRLVYSLHSPQPPLPPATSPHPNLRLPPSLLASSPPFPFSFQSLASQAAACVFAQWLCLRRKGGCCRPEGGRKESARERGVEQERESERQPSER